MHRLLPLAFSPSCNGGSDPIAHSASDQPLSQPFEHLKRPGSGAQCGGINPVRCPSFGSRTNVSPPVASESVIRTSPARIKTSVPSAFALAATRFNERVEGRLQIFCDLPGPGRNTGEDEGFILTVDGATGAWKAKRLPVALIPANPIV